MLPAGLVHDSLSSVDVQFVRILERSPVRARAAAAGRQLAHGWQSVNAIFGVGSNERRWSRRPFDTFRELPEVALELRDGCCETFQVEVDLAGPVLDSEFDAGRDEEIFLRLELAVRVDVVCYKVAVRTQLSSAELRPQADLLHLLRQLDPGLGDLSSVTLCYPEDVVQVDILEVLRRSNDIAKLLAQTEAEQLQVLARLLHPTHLVRAGMGKILDALPGHLLRIANGAAGAVAARPQLVVHPRILDLARRPGGTLCPRRHGGHVDQGWGLRRAGGLLDVLVHGVGGVSAKRK